jgi:hypothetical protein
VFSLPPKKNEREKERKKDKTRYASVENLKTSNLMPCEGSNIYSR